MLGLIIYVMWVILGLFAYVLEKEDCTVVSMLCYIVFFCFVPFFPFVWHMLGMF